MKARILLSSALILMAAGCSSDPDPAEKPEGKPTKPAPSKPADGKAKVYPLKSSYAGDWKRADGVTYTVEDDGTTLTGKLKEDPRERLASVEFTLERKDNKLVGTAKWTTKDDPALEAETKWELSAAETGLTGKLQAAYVDDGELILFADDPHYETHGFTVAGAPKPEPVAKKPEDPKPGDDDDDDDDDDKPTPTKVDDKPADIAKKPGDDDDDDDDKPETKPGDDDDDDDDKPETKPGDDDDDDDDKPEKKPGDDDDDDDDDKPKPTKVEDPVKADPDAAKRDAAEKEEARLAKEREERDAEEENGTGKNPPVYSDTKIAEQSKTPEGLARMLFDAIAWGKSELFEACWLNKEDAQAMYKSKKKAAKVFRFASRFQLKSWAELRRLHPEIRKATIKQVEMPVKTAKGQKRVRGGKITYEYQGRERTITMDALIQMPSGTWKAFTLVPAKKK